LIWRKEKTAPVEKRNTSIALYEKGFAAPKLQYQDKQYSLLTFSAATTTELSTPPGTLRLNVKSCLYFD
jgi:hypothetical protein